MSIDCRTRRSDYTRSTSRRACETQPARAIRNHAIEVDASSPLPACMQPASSVCTPSHAQHTCSTHTAQHVHLWLRRQLPRTKMRSAITPPPGIRLAVVCTRPAVSRTAASPPPCGQTGSHAGLGWLLSPRDSYAQRKIAPKSTC